MAFPTLSSAPLISGFNEAAALDPVIRSPKEAGYVQTRPRFTRVPKKFHVTYASMTDSDKSALESWEATVGYGANSDTWMHPKTSVSYTVRLTGPIKYALGETDSLWTFDFDLEEV